MVNVFTVSHCFSDGLLLNSVKLSTSHCDWHVVAHTYPERSMCSLNFSYGTHRLWHQDSNTLFTLVCRYCP